MNLRESAGSICSIDAVHQADRIDPVDILHMARSLSLASKWPRPDMSNMM